MKCQRVKKQLVLYVGDDLPVNKKRSVESHLENCPACVTELEELKRMKEGVHTIAQSDIPDTLLLVASAVLFLLLPSKVSSVRLAKEILAISETGSSELAWDPEHIFFKAFDGPYRLDSWEAPKQSGVYAVLHKTASDTGPVTYIMDYCGQGRNLSSYRGYPWIYHRMKRLVSRTGSEENVYVAVFLMPNSSKLERRQIEEALLKTFNPYFNRGV
jgi:hypothetical protein